MRHAQVHWHEGMFLGPQHFQSSDRHWNEKVAVNAHWSCRDFYGVRSIEIDAEALRNSIVDISMIEARFREGTIVGYHPTKRRLAPVSLAGVFEGAGTAFVFLCMEQSGVQTQQADGGRYQVLEKRVDDENSGKEHTVDLREPHCFLKVVPITGSETSSSALAPRGLESLPLFKISRSGSADSFPEIARTYFPPMIETQAWHALEYDVIKALFHLVEQNADVLAARNREVTFSGARNEGSFDSLFKLSILNRASATLKNFGAVNSTHPALAYYEFCRLYGDLAVLGVERRIDRDIPAYDHEDLYGIFTWLKIRIESLVHAQKQGWDKVDFVGHGQTMQVMLREDWLGPDWTWYVAVDGVSRERFEKIRSRLNWKMSSGTEVDRTLRQRAEGLELGPPLHQAPDSLPIESWIYYRVSKSGSYWHQIVKDKSLALKVNPDAVKNIDTWEGETRMHLVDGEDVLRFRLYVVPKSPQT